MLEATDNYSADEIFSEFSGELTAEEVFGSVDVPDQIELDGVSADELSMEAAFSGIDESAQESGLVLEADAADDYFSEFGGSSAAAPASPVVEEPATSVDEAAGVEPSKATVIDVDFDDVTAEAAPAVVDQEAEPRAEAKAKKKAKKRESSKARAKREAKKRRKSATRADAKDTESVVVSLEELQKDPQVQKAVARNERKKKKRSGPLSGLAAAEQKLRDDTAKVRPARRPAKKQDKKKKAPKRNKSKKAKKRDASKPKINTRPGEQNANKLRRLRNEGRQLPKKVDIEVVKPEDQSDAAANMALAAVLTFLVILYYIFV